MFSPQMAWVCAEPSRFRTSDKPDERFHVQQDARHVRTTHRTSRTCTGKSAWHSSNENSARRAGQILPSMTLAITHSSAGTCRKRPRLHVSRSAHRMRRRLHRYARPRPSDCTYQPPRIGRVLLVVKGRARPNPVSRPEAALTAASEVQRAFAQQRRSACTRLRTQARAASNLVWRP